MDKIKVVCYRFNKNKDPKEYYQVYEIPYHDGMSLLEILIYISENIDPALAYPKHSLCKQGICGECTLKMNDKPVLPCIESPKDPIIIVEPLRKDKVVRDLVIPR